MPGAVYNHQQLNDPVRDVIEDDSSDIIETELEEEDTAGDEELIIIVTIWMSRESTLINIMAKITIEQMETITMTAMMI